MMPLDHELIQPGRPSRNLQASGQHGVVQLFYTDLPLAKLHLHAIVYDLLLGVAWRLLAVSSFSLVDVFSFGILPRGNSGNSLVSAHVGKTFPLPLVLVVFENEPDLRKRCCDLRPAGPSLLHSVPASTTKGVSTTHMRRA